MIPALNETDTLLFAAAVTNNATQTANLDTRGADWATIRLNFNAEVNTNAVGPTIALSESDDTVVTNFATITANRTNEDLTSARAVRYDVDLRNRKRYLRLAVTAATATNDHIVVSAVATLSRKDKTPEAHTELSTVAVVVA